MKNKDFNVNQPVSRRHIDLYFKYTRGWYINV